MFAQMKFGLRIPFRKKRLAAHTIVRWLLRLGIGLKNGNRCVCLSGMKRGDCWRTNNQTSGGSCVLLLCCIGGGIGLPVSSTRLVSKAPS